MLTIYLKMGEASEGARGIGNLEFEAHSRAAEDFRPRWG